MSTAGETSRTGLRGMLARFPWWLGLALGLALLPTGLWLMVRPLSSTSLLVIVIGLTLILNGLGELLQLRAGWSSFVAAAGLIAAGVAVLVFRGFTTDALAILIALAPIAIGILRLITVMRPGAEDRATGLVLAAAAVLAGLIALAWPDLSLLIAAIAFGGWTMLLGLQLIWGAVTSRHRASAVPVAAPVPARRGFFARWARLIGAVVMLAIVVVVGMVSVRLHQGVPEVDGFYAAPAIVPPEPGVLLRAEPFTRGMPKAAEAWRILYTTTRDEGQPALASALVVAPRTRPASPSPLIAWTHGTTGYAEACAPSLLPDPLGSGAMFIADQVIARGWTLVATDYLGLGTAGPHPYLIGPGEGRSALDSIRAAHQLKGLQLAGRTVVWGHSQGGHAALWTGGLAPTYAPELDIAGVAALAPASDLQGLIASLSALRGGILFASFALAAYDAAYEDVRETDYVDPAAQTLLRQLSTRCLADPRTFVSIAEAFAIADDRDVFSIPLTAGPIVPRLQQNTPTLPIPAPLLIGQGLGDTLVVPRVQHAYAEARCASGQALTYIGVPDRDHVGLVEAPSPLIPELLQWTADRFAGAPATDGCGALEGD